MILTKNDARRIFPVVLLLAAALLAAGCCCTCPDYIGQKGPEPVNILVLQSAEGHAVLVFPDTVRICEERQFARWVLSGAPVGTRLEISFPDGSPFTEKKSERERPHVVESGVARKGTAGKRYKYVVTVRNERGEKTESLDPFVEILR